jgi:hypothetical protein
MLRQHVPLRFLTPHLSQAAKKAGRVGRAAFVQYNDLANTLVTKTFPDHFALVGSDANSERALEISKRYSKGRSGADKAGEWHTDVKKKHKVAGARLKKWAAEYLQPIFEKIQAYAS